MCKPLQSQRREFREDREESGEGSSPEIRSRWPRRSWPSCLRPSSVWRCSCWERLTGQGCQGRPPPVEWWKVSESETGWRWQRSVVQLRDTCYGNESFNLSFLTNAFFNTVDSATLKIPEHFFV